MILRSKARPLTLLQGVLRSSQRRCEHTVPELGTLNSKGSFFAENGVPGLFTPKTYKQVWQQYQQHLCDEVNSTSAGLQRFANLTPLQLHQQLAHSPNYASLYNFAAMLHFNHFFWESLSTEKKSVPADSALDKQIKDDFGSAEQLRIEMLQRADAMFGNGFVWLVRQAPGNDVYATNRAAQGLRILCTYNAGSPYPGAHMRRQDTDMATTDPQAVMMGRTLTGGSSTSDQMNRVQNRPGSFGNQAQAWPNALSAQPILCLNVWQHTYLHDYGILGKRAYLAAWWERIDWDIVQTRFAGAELPASRTGPLSFLNR